MGCDIHYWIERQQDDGTWECVYSTEAPDATDPEYTEGYARLAARGRPEKLYIPRDYGLFGLLAGVRCWGMKPIRPKREWPDDLSFVIEWATTMWADDWHSRTWYTLRDFIEFDWDQVISHGDEREEFYRMRNMIGSTYRRYFRSFINDFVEALKQFGPPDKVRVMIFFDN